MTGLLIVVLRVSLLFLGAWLVCQSQTIRPKTRLRVILLAAALSPLFLLPVGELRVGLADHSRPVSNAIADDFDEVPPDVWQRHRATALEVDVALSILVALSATVGLALAASRLLATRKLVRDSESISDSCVAALASDAATEVGLGTVPDVRLTDDCARVQSAAVAGASIVFCRSWQQGKSLPQLRQALLHECMHIKNCDHAQLVAFSILTSWLLFNPVTHMLRKCLVRTMEDRVTVQLGALEGFVVSDYSSLFEPQAVGALGAEVGLSRVVHTRGKTGVVSFWLCALGVASMLAAAPVRLTWSEPVSDFVFNAGVDDTVQVFQWRSEVGSAAALTKGPLSFGHPSPSPDRGSVAFVRDVAGNRDVYVVDLSTARERRLTYDAGRDDLPKFSPDGNYVSYSARRDRLWQVYVLDLRSGQETRVTDGQFNELESAWHPSGDRLLFSSDRAGEPGGQRIWSCRLDGTDLRQLTTSSGMATGGAYSPDGERIVFTAHWDFKWDVFVKELRTGKIVRVADSLATDTEAVFLSNHIVAFSTFRNRTPQVATVDVRDPDGSLSLLAPGHWPQP